MEPLETPEGLRARAAEDLIVAEYLREKDDELTTSIVSICSNMSRKV